MQRHHVQQLRRLWRHGHPAASVPRTITCHLDNSRACTTTATAPKLVEGREGQQTTAAPNEADSWSLGPAVMEAAHAMQQRPTDSPQLRPYQQDAIDAMLANYKAGITRMLVGMPTGAGKTVVFATLARLLNYRTLVLVHREQLMEQTVKALKWVWPGVNVGCLQGRKNAFDTHVVVATVQTASNTKRLESLANGPPFGLCIVDEAHHAPASTYQVVLRTLGFLEDTPDKMLLGVTATPYRRDHLLLSDTFQTQAFDVSIGELIEYGALCGIKARRIMTYTDLSTAKLQTISTKGAPSADEVEDGIADYSQRELSRLVNTPERNRLVATSYKQLAGGRKAIAFACTIAHADDMAAAFVAEGVAAAALHTKMPQEQRVAVLQAHKQGKLQVLTNVGILTEGYDDTSISCVLMTRPTKSPALYTQCVGRGFRSHPGKQDCLVLDFTDRDHRLDHPSDLMDIRCVVKEDGQGVQLTNYKSKEVPASIERELEKIIVGGKLQLYTKFAYCWVPYGGAYFLQLWTGDTKGEATYLYLQLRRCDPSAQDQQAAYAHEVVHVDLSRSSSPNTTCWELLYLVEETRSGPWGRWNMLMLLNGGRTAEQVLQRVEKELQKPCWPILQNSTLAQFQKELYKCRHSLKWRAQPITDQQKERLANYGLDDEQVVDWLRASSPIGATYGSKSMEDPWGNVTKGQASLALTLLYIESKMAARPALESDVAKDAVPATQAQLRFLTGLVRQAVAAVDLQTASGLLEEDALLAGCQQQLASACTSGPQPMTTGVTEDMLAKAHKVLHSPELLTKLEAADLAAYFRAWLSSNK